MRTLLVGLSLLAPAVAQGPLQATLLALQPIEAEWTSAPPGTPGALASVPSGPITRAEVHAPAGQNWATFDCSLAPLGGGVRVLASSVVFPPGAELAETRADLLLLLSAPQPTTVALDLHVAHFGDTPSAGGFRIDLGDDGSDELDTSSPECCGSVRRFAATTTIGPGGLSVRIRSTNTMGASPQAFELWLDAEPWHPAATPISPACDALATKLPPQGYYQGNYQLAALPPVSPFEFALLRASGLGPFDLFVVSADPGTAPLTLPAPLPGPCDLLTNLVFAIPGEATILSPARSGFELRVPPLPPGLVLYVQHVSVENEVAPFAFGTTNVVRIDT